MAKFIVKSHITRGKGDAKKGWKDGHGNVIDRGHIETHEPGEIIELTEAEAAEMPHAIEPVKEPKAQAGK